MLDYFSIALVLFIGTIMALAFIAIPLLLAPSHSYYDKNCPYECGFDTYRGSLSRFNITFSIVAILFVLFDVEVAFLFIWSLIFQDVSLMGFYAMILFLFLLFLGFMYEWIHGVLNW